MPATKRIDRAHRTNAPQAPAPDPVRDAIGITALAKAHNADNHRDLLKPGLHNVNLTIYGEIDAEKWQRAINGVLTISPDSAPVASSTTPWEGLLLSALCSMSARQRQAWLGIVAAGHVPEPDCCADKVDSVKAEMDPALRGYR
ncbi:MAG: hypothetical protein WAV76_09850, partial [Bacteroidota bacterium]